VEQIRELIFYKQFFEEFFEGLTEKVKEKIDYVLYLVTHAERVPEKFLKHLEGSKGLYEIRVEVGNNIYRIFCCFDKGKVVVLFNGFQKKTQKTPKGEIEQALKLMQEYFDDQKTKK
jgi:phage-related protein